MILFPLLTGGACPNTYIFMMKNWICLLHLPTFFHKNLRCCLNMCHKKSISKTEKLRFYNRAKLSIMPFAIIWTQTLTISNNPFWRCWYQDLYPFYILWGINRSPNLEFCRKNPSLVWKETHFSKYFLSLKSSFPRLPLLLPLAATIAEHLRAGSSWHSNIESLDP